MPNDVETWFEEASSMADPIDRAQALCDLALDAENMAAQGEREDAICLLELLTTLDRDDDLLFPAVRNAEETLISLGVRSLRPWEDVVAETMLQFKDSTERQHLLAAAKTLVKTYATRPEAWRTALTLLNDAERIEPLNDKEKRFYLDVLRRNKTNEKPA